MGFFNNYPYTDFHELNLDWCIEQIKTLITAIEELDERTKEVEELYQKMMDIYNNLLEMYKKIIAGEIPQPIIDTILRWCRQNIPALIAEAVKNVLFGLDYDGHFVAYIPESWDFLHFDTIMDPNSDFYGHLLLEW